MSVLTGGTDVHLVLCDLRESAMDGQQAEDRLHTVGITVNRNAVPFDPRPPAVSSGLRIGTPALATRGLGVDDFAEIGGIIVETLTLSDAEFDARRGICSSASPRSPTATRCTPGCGPKRSSLSAGSTPVRPLVPPVCGRLCRRSRGRPAAAVCAGRVPACVPGVSACQLCLKAL